MFQNILGKEVAKTGKHRTGLNLNEFMELFEVLSDLPEYRNALRLANGEGEDKMNAQQLLKFLTEEQEVKSITFICKKSIF